MPVTNFTSLLGLALPTTGDLAGTWGDTVNNSITSLVDSAVAGTTTLSTDADVTLTTTTGAANQARQMILVCSGSRTAQRTITAPAASKAYIVINATTGGFGVKVVGAGPTTGVTIANGRAEVIAWNGSDFIAVASNDVNDLLGFGTNVLTALTTNVGTAGSIVVNGGVLGTPSSGTLTNCTGLPASTGISGLGTGVATALGQNVSGSSGGIVLTTGASLTTPALAGETFSTSATVSAAGTNQGTATALTSDYNVVTTAAASSGVALPTATTGRRVIVVNKGANAVNVYPASGGTIDALAANAAISVPVAGYIEFNASSTTQWYSSFNAYISGAGVTSFSAGTTGFTPSTATTGAITLAGTLITSNGGTGLSSYTAGDLPYYATGTALSKLGIGTVNQVLTSSGTAPQWSSALTVTGLTDSGNLTFTGTGNRITGDFSNATHANRVMFQTSTVNARTNISALPNGTSTTAGIDLYGSSSDPANASLFRIANTNAEYQLEGTRLGTGTYLPMTFYTGGSERMRIDTSGNVGIGTSSPGAILHTVKTSSGASTVGAFLQNSSFTTSTEVRLAFAANANSLSEDRYGWVGYVNTGGTNGGALTFATTPGGTPATERMRIDSSGNLLVGTTITTNNSRLKVQGSSTSSADYMVQFTDSAGANAIYIKNDRSVFSDGIFNSTTASAANVFINGSAQLQRSTSSLKYKTDVHDATHGLAEVMQLRPVTYKGKNDGDTVFGGLIAEEVDAAGLTEFVQYADDGTPDALAYGNMVSLCIKAIQELKAELDATKAEVAALKGA